MTPALGWAKPAAPCGVDLGACEQSGFAMGTVLEKKKKSPSKIPAEMCVFLGASMKKGDV